MRDEVATGAVVRRHHEQTREPPHFSFERYRPALRSHFVGARGKRPPPHRRSARAGGWVFPNKSGPACTGPDLYPGRKAAMDMAHAVSASGSGSLSAVTAGNSMAPGSQSQPLRSCSGALSLAFLLASKCFTSAATICFLV